ncbi:putative WD domain, G-beta repeat [Lyophyllum shimeji]|uniref:WD domain, G-beta repeat n=1 Tax=Lyophyllum shimeji TaxID=47721 RepID=A0A9P3PFY4_LYOSH|nr:putative WD domain, G-beta repeat [Lyophyllum shimeji]
MDNESTFVAPEGVYTVTDEHKPPLNLSVYGGPAVYPTKVASVVIKFPATKQGGPSGFVQLLGGNKDTKKDRLSAPKEREDGASLSSSDTPDEGDQPTSTQEHGPANASVTQEPHTLFSPNPAAPGRKRPASRPKHNIRTTSSTFITRIQTAEGLTKTLQSKQGDTTFLFYNLAKSWLWVEAGSKAKDPLCRITFSTNPTCHDVNTSTASPEHLDVVIGFASGDLVWLDPVTSRYARLNKQGCISNSPCTAVRWVPSSSTLFLVSHADGTIVVYDKERDDGTFTPQDPVGRSADSNGASSSEEGTSQKDWDSTDSIFVTMPPWHPVTSSGGGGLTASGKPDKEKAAKNPVSHWRVSRRSIVDFVFSPDVKYVAAISEDGCLRVIDALAEQLVDCYASYFGALTCVAWSHDGRFILTGGQDDLLTIFSPWEQRVVARCQGHSSFVSSLAFDDLRCDGRTYRFGSVGEDNKLILWDFSSGALHRPKTQATHHQRMSMSSTISLALRRERSAHHLPAINSPGLDGRSPRYHPAPSRNEIAVVQPVLVKSIEGDILTAVSFLPRSVLTSTKSGHIKLWIRPLALRPRIKNGRAADIDPLT